MAMPTAMREAHAGSEKPVVFINNLAALGDDDLAVHITRDGHAGADRHRPGAGRDPRRHGAARFPPAPAMASAGRARGLAGPLAAAARQGAALDEAESLALFADYGVRCCRIGSSRAPQRR